MSRKSSPDAFLQLSPRETTTKQLRTDNDRQKNEEAKEAKIGDEKMGCRWELGWKERAVLRILSLGFWHATIDCRSIGLSGEAPLMSKSCSQPEMAWKSSIS